MFGDPEYFDIEQKKVFGLWPHDQLISRAMNPYIRRMRRDKVAMLVVGDLKGESVNDFLTENEKIIKVNVINNYNEDTESFKEVLKNNTEKFKGKIDLGISKNKLRDIVCIDNSACNVENLELYYKNVNSGGIFCGNGHDLQSTKDTLTEFRRNTKIGTPIQVCYKTIWFWYTR
jgi:hypothetical protein